MAIIKPSRQFEGSDLSTGVFGKIIKDTVRQINFRDDNYKTGAYFFILPPYKLDAAGNGAWYKTVQVRDNFGVSIKESFAVPPNCPIRYFDSQCATKFPNYAKIQKNVPVEGTNRTRTIYPSFGRVANKVVFNVVPYKEMTIGAHVMLLPQFGAAEVLEQWGRKKQMNGIDFMPMLNDPERAIPVWVALRKDKAAGNPWEVTIDGSNGYKLPPELSDTDFLYNLDDVIHYWEPEYLIEKLRSFTPGDIFEACMAGYSDGKTKVSMVTPAVIAAPVVAAPAPTPSAMPTLAPPPQSHGVIPKASIPSQVQSQPAEPTYAPVFANPNATASPTLAGSPAQTTAKYTEEQARALLLSMKNQ